MAEKRIKNMSTASSDDFQTPAAALYPLLKYLGLLDGRSKTVWEPAAGRGNLVDGFKGYGYNVIGSDILTGQDFLTWEPEDDYDIIVTNPPFSLKGQFLERCYQLNKPFALLLPLTALESQKRQKLYKEYGINLLLLPKRINFICPFEEGSTSWFSTAWYISNHFGLKDQLTFVDVKDCLW